MDLVLDPRKICTFDCIYCQLGPTRNPRTAPSCFVSTARFVRELEEALKKVEADFLTFSGTGEPTLASNLGEAIREAKRRTSLPIAILTNSSLLHRDEVRRALREADVIVAKLDAPAEEIFHLVNRPFGNLRLEDIVRGIRMLRREFGGKLALQMMFVSHNKTRASEMAELASFLEPDEIQLNTPLRPSPVPPLSPEEMREIKKAFEPLGRRGVKVISVYEASRPQVIPLDFEEIKMRGRK